MSRTAMNALGQPVYYSGISTAWFSATGSGPTLYGTSGNDSIWGDSSVDVTMIGGAGDDIYYLYSSTNRAEEAPGAGVDSIDTWMSYVLPENFENLTVTGDGRYAFGNSADNILTGGSGSQTIDGRAGNDVLIGSGGADTFVFEYGNGSDLITDFSSNDTIRLDGYGLTSFQEVLANATEKGDDLRLQLADGESLVLEDTTADQLQEGQFQLSLDRSAFTQTFSDDFDTLQLTNGSSGVWDAKYWWAPEKGATLTENSELQWYVNPDYEPTASVNPFSVEDGVLTITAERASEAIQSEIGGYDYTSGMLTTYSSFAQTYGYFEMRADMPDDQGAWPAFWLLPADGSWPPELDVVEMRGQDANTVITTAHSNESGEHTVSREGVQVADTGGFHDYGVLWTEDEIVWYFDNTEIARADTPADMHEPMYMIVNLAVGGMADTPDDDFADGSEMKIDHIEAYSLDSDWYI
ncbi:MULTISPECIES: family 16 glycosylhydrolase [unclassified Ensifer]|uniref:family 16 glycosylhydrolase n=1 Tax=unclassified Ensifer TaxID=2633371 RepID=UPI0008135402|nr:MULTISPECIES: family 16 glycosylhydrolase [unclassified Ensifer]OCP06340.1 1,3-1,4-beta-glycanase [Ensifer sp. LC11]OCP09099.1 1,3-1,4-beta-glycanase [Ensifer sp. LC13]OCP09882.1 1,3-1,4-beta-glycanase [Ensifer sp. LC14]OCP31597.1 1,3-1,4-beta-glycanase [Ensifer sp. LC499]